MSSRSISHALCLMLITLVVPGFTADTGKNATVNGFVLDSACAFTRDLQKPVSADCARACARAGSPLVILANDGTIYWPISATTPASGQNETLLPFAGQKVTAVGRVFQRGGSTALVIEKILAVSGPK
jgi:hypothetical protein